MRFSRAGYSPAHRPSPRVAVAPAAVLVVAGAIAVPATAATTPAAVVSVAPSSSVVGQKVAATLSGSTVPSGDPLKSIRLRWGDGTAAVVVTALTAHPAHRYQRPGTYTVTLTLVDARNTVARGTAQEQVTAPPGSYTGTNQFGAPFHFYVSYGHTAVQDVAIGGTSLTCSPGGATVSDLLTIGSLAIGRNGSFSATRSQHGILHPGGGNYPATFTYLFAGRFTGVDSAGDVTAAGTWRETITYSDSAPRTCTTNTQSWSATRDAQPGQNYRVPARGSYTGHNQYGAGFPLYVSGDQAHVQDVAINTVVYCAPGTASFDDHLSIAAATIGADGSFAATVVQHGVFAHQHATFTFVIGGHFHAVDAQGNLRAAGVWRETVSYTDSAPRTCSTDEQPFTVTRDAQPAQTTTRPPAGTYAGTDQVGAPFTFDVATGRASLGNVAIITYLQCTPGTNSPSDHLAIASLPLNADGSFVATVTQGGNFAGHTAQFSYDFRGHFHGVGADGVPRAAGTFDETVTYTNGVPYTCTTDGQNWTAELSTSP